MISLVDQSTARAETTYLVGDKICLLVVTPDVKKGKNILICNIFRPLTLTNR